MHQNGVHGALCCYARQRPQIPGARFQRISKFCQIASIRHRTLGTLRSTQASIIPTPSPPSPQGEQHNLKGDHAFDSRTTAAPFLLKSGCPLLSKQKKLEAAGWKTGSASDFLELSEAEEILVNIKLSLASKVREMRIKRKITQQQLAKLLGSSQSRIAKLEKADRSVSVELLMRSLVTLGASRSQIGKIIGTRSAARRQSKSAKKRLAKV